MRAYGTCARALTGGEALPVPTTPIARPGRDIVAQLEAAHARQSPIVLQNPAPVLTLPKRKPEKPPPAPKVKASRAPRPAPAPKLALKASTVRARAPRLTPPPKPAKTPRSVAEPRERTPRAHVVDDQTVAQLYLTGLSIPKVAAQLGHTPATIRRSLFRTSTHLRDDRATYSGRHRRTRTIELDVAIVTAYLADPNVSISEVAAAHHVSPQTAGRVLREAGVTVRLSSMVQRGRLGVDQAAALRNLMDLNEITSADVRAWAALTGRHCPLVGTPSRALVEDYLLEHRSTTNRKKEPA